MEIYKDLSNPASKEFEKLLNNQSVQSEKIVYDCIDYPPIKKDASD